MILTIRHIIPTVGIRGTTCPTIQGCPTNIYTICILSTRRCLNSRSFVIATRTHPKRSGIPPVVLRATIFTTYIKLSPAYNNTKLPSIYHCGTLHNTLCSYTYSVPSNRLELRKNNSDLVVHILVLLL